MKTRLLAVPVVLSIGLTACGGSSALSRADISKKANSICAAAEKKGKAIKAPSNIQDASAAASYFDKIAPIIDQETKDLKGLTPDSKVKADWNAFIAKQVAATDLLDTIKSKADKKDASGLKDLQQFGTVGDAVTAAADKVGATNCK